MKTRFAPSPTGYLHIGGVRTAIYNWLWAKKNGGQFILRIDDTDESRNNSLALQPILDGLQWLGINWDEGPIYQSDRQELYQEWFEYLKHTNAIYQDNGAWRFNVKHIQSAFCDNCTIKDGLVTIKDMVRGEVSWPIKDLKDPIIVRSDGKFLYNFATVVDDFSMEITDVLRAEEHLSNTPIQVLLYFACGKFPPKFGHIPFIRAMKSKKKLSKRDVSEQMSVGVIQQLKLMGFSSDEIKDNPNLNPITIEYYKALGFLPEAIVNYLIKLGWSPDGYSEKFSIEEAIKMFDVSKISLSSAGFDPLKLDWLQKKYMQQVCGPAKQQGAIKALNKAGVKNVDLEVLDRFLFVAGDRVKTYSDIVSDGLVYFTDIVHDRAKIKKYIYDSQMVKALPDFSKLLIEKQYSTADLSDIGEKFVAGLVGYSSLKTRFFYQAMRVALTNSENGMSPFVSIFILGVAEAKRRLYLAAQEAGYNAQRE